MNEKSVLNDIRELKKEIFNAKKVPFSRYVSIDRDNILSRLEKIEQELPQEMKNAFFVDKKREEIIEKAYEERKKILEQAQKEKEKLVSNSDIIKQAKLEKERILQDAREEANEIIKEAEEYAAQILKKVQDVLENAQAIIKKGREALLYEDSDSENKEQ